MSVIDDIRSDHEDLAKVLKKHLGIRKTVEELYPDSAHFIYELLQNAEDTGAKKVNFYLTKDALVFAHDGRPFNERDIKGITDIGDGSKSEDNDSIGQFGIGFKAVFAYCETPRIWSPTYSFEIRELVLPFEIDSKKGCDNRTCFEFPFNNPKKDKSDSYNEVKEGLKKLPAMTLLFLSSIETINWQINDSKGNSVQRIEHDENHIELQKILNNTLSSSKHFLRFSKALDEHEKQYVSIAFNLEYLNKVDKFDPNKKLSEQMKIVPASPGRVSVYFPAEKEISGLRFHLHAPFVPELSRASIKDTPVNNPLYIELAKLSVEALWKIHDQDFLTGEFLAVLPNILETLSVKYFIIRTSIIDAMSHQKLTPTYNNSYKEATFLVQAKTSLKQLLTVDDLNFLLANENIQYDWVIGVSNNSLQDKFLTSLRIKKFSIENMVEELSERIDPWIAEMEPFDDEDHEQKKLYDQTMTWLEYKDEYWIQKLYVQIYNEELVIDVLDLPIVRLLDNSFGIGKKSFFSNEQSVNKDFQIVNEEVYTSGSNKENEFAKLFLEELGVHEIEEADKINVLLREKYTEGSLYPSINDIKYFMSFIETHPSKKDIFSSYYIVEDENGEWCKPDDVYLCEPFMRNRLQIYFDALQNTKELRTEKYNTLEDKLDWWDFYQLKHGLANLSELADSLELKTKVSSKYTNTGFTLDKCIDFFKKIGVQTSLDITKISISSNPKRKYLKDAPGSTFTDTGINIDYTIVGLEEISTIKDKKLSLLIWKKMMSIKTTRYAKNYFEATYQYNQSNTGRHADSLLIHLLKTLSWVPQSDDTFVTPAEASVELLPDGFSYDSGKEWLKLVRFGEETEQKKEKEKEKEKFAKELGFDTKEDLEDAQAFLNLSPDERRAILDANRKHGNGLPENAPRNPEFREGRVGEEADNAPEDTKSNRTRSVPDNDPEVKKQVDSYLRQQYTNMDNEMICQICSKELPFKKANGEFYFEKVKFLGKLQKLHYQNYLALCPNHAAMYKVINNSKDELLENFKALNENETELKVMLGDENMKIYFTKTHILDMKTVIDIDEREDTE